MSPDLPTIAADRYETLRAQALEGGGQRGAFAVLLYHGMYQGLVQLTHTPSPQRQPLSAPAPVPTDHALIRQVATMILNVQSELTHVY